MLTGGNELAKRSQNILVHDTFTEVKEEHDEGIPLLTEFERRQLAAWNATRQDYPQGACVQQLVARQAMTTPDAVAIVAGDQTLSYRELNLRANRLARYLQALGVKPNVLVGLCIERSLDMVVGLLGILKAGGAYVPLDPAYPPERPAFTLNDLAYVSTLQVRQAIPRACKSPIRVCSTCYSGISEPSQ
jgi:non-ribosomal peptide synthetase component F